MIALALEMLWATWLGVTEEGSLLRRLAPGLVGTFSVLLVWSIVWSLVSKTLTGVVSFWRHVCIACGWLADSLPRDARIFEPGCGSGANLLWLAQQGFTRLQGADISAEVVALCRGLHVPVLDP